MAGATLGKASHGMLGSALPFPFAVPSLNQKLGTRAAWAWLASHVPGFEGTVILHALLEGHTPVLLAKHQ